MKRLFWLSVGAVVGASGTVWAERKVRAQLEALQPDHLAVMAQKRVVSFAHQILEATVEGRSAMRERETELKDRYHNPTATEFPAAVIDISSAPISQSRQRR